MGVSGEAAVTTTGTAARRPWVGGALASLALCMLLPSLGTSIANVALPTLAGTFAAPFQHVQWVVLAYLLATTTSIVGMGRLGDLVGRRRLLLAGILLFTAASALCGMAPGLWLLVLARALQGLGAAVMMALTLALAGEAVPKGKTGSAMGLLGTMSAVGTALGPALGGLLIDSFGWQAIFLANVPLGLLTLGLAQRCLPRDRRAVPAARARFDTAGTLLLTVTLAAYALAMTSGHGRFGAANLALLAAAAIGSGFFLRAEAKAAAPLIPLSRLRDPRLTASLGMSALVSTVMMTTLVVGPFYLAQALGLDATLVGIVMSAGPVVAALSGVPAGRLVDRFGAHRLSFGGLAAMTVGCAALSLSSFTPGIAGYVIPIVVLTAGYAVFQTANNTAVMSTVSPDQRGVTSALLTLSRNLGLITGAAVMAAIFATASRADDAARGLQVTFGVAATLLVVALLISAVSVTGSRSARVDRPSR